MIAKYWKKIGLVLIIIACVFNALIKLINKGSLEDEMLSSAQYMYDKEQTEKANSNSEEEKKEDNNKKNSENEQEKKTTKKSKKKTE